MIISINAMFVKLRFGKISDYKNIWEKVMCEKKNVGFKDQILPFMFWSDSVKVVSFFTRSFIGPTIRI